jgi:tetratricopeptide (TPR) repeat protein
VTWVEGHCISYGANVPYLPVVDLLKNTVGVQDEDGDAKVVRRVDDVVAAWETSARGAAPYLKLLLSVDPGDDAVATMDPQERRVEVLQALRTFLLQESAGRPHVIVVEDLHWADEMSKEALAVLADAVPSAPVLLVLTYRPGYLHPLGDHGHPVSLTLGSLEDEDSVALVEGILHGSTLPSELQRLIAGKAEGNPFYVEEVTKALIEGGIMVRTNGSYALQRPVEEIHIPESIQEVVLSRIDRLEREAKQAIQLASVIGREFRARLLERISDLEAKLSEVLGELQALELIYEKALFPELAYIFKHALTHDVAYGTLLEQRRRRLHRLVGTAVEELYPDRLAEHYETLAHHYWEGQDWQKALDYLDKAGDKATAAYANHDALHYYARALEVCETLGDTALATAASLGEKRGQVNFGVGELPAAIADLDRTVVAGRRLGDRSIEGKGLAFRAFLEVYNHDFEQAEVTLQSAWAIIGEGFDEVRPMASLAMGNLLAVSNRMPELLPLLDSVAALPAMPDAFSDGLWNWNQGLIDFWRGHFDTALETLEGISERAERNVTNRLFNWWIRGLALAGRGDYESALSILRKTVDMCERVGDWQVRGRVVNSIGWVFAELEDHEQALRWNRSGMELVGRVSSMPDAEVEMNTRLNLCDNLDALGRREEAEDQFKTVEAAVRHPNKVQLWLLWRYSLHFFSSYGAHLLGRGDPAGALAHADECLQVADETGSEKYLAKGRQLRGQSLMALGRLDDAERELSTALEAALELANPPQLWRAYAAIGDLRRAQGRALDARESYGEALSLVESVAAGLTDESLRQTLRHSPRVEALVSALDEQA